VQSGLPAHEATLDPALAAGLRARIGWTVDAEDLLRRARAAGTAVRFVVTQDSSVLVAVYFEPRLASPNSQAPERRLS